MARERKKKDNQGGVEIDLTPMIDVVFQLIIFFMVVTQITTQDNVTLRLPDAVAANEEDPQAKKLFTVHIAPVDQKSNTDMPDKFGWFCHGVAMARDTKEMESILASEAEIVDPLRELTGRGPDGISENMIVVRCDARAPAGEFAALIELMVKVKLYKIKIAIMKDEER